MTDWQIPAGPLTSLRVSRLPADIMMWNNAGSFLAPKQAVVHTPVVPCNSGDSSDPPCSSCGDENLDFNMDFTVTTPVPTPSALKIASRDPFLGVEKPVEMQSSFFAEQNVQNPRLIHKVNIEYNSVGAPVYISYSIYTIATTLCTHHTSFMRIIVTNALEVLRAEGSQCFGKGHVETLLLSSDTDPGVSNRSVTRSSPDGRSIMFAEMAKRPTCLGSYDREAWRLQIKDHAKCQD